MAQRIGDELVTDKQYRTLRRRWREARTSKPFASWAKHELSEAGARDRHLVTTQRDREAANQRRIAAGITAQRRAMDDDWSRLERLGRLRQQANQRDATGNYTDAAVKAQRQLAAAGA